MTRRYYAACDRCRAVMGEDTPQCEIHMFTTGGPLPIQLQHVKVVQDLCGDCVDQVRAAIIAALKAIP